MNLVHNIFKMAASEQMKTLTKKKDDIEGELSQLTEVLDSQKGVGMNGPLIDEEGYPRSDIDVYAVRHARHKIACLQTDHKLVMKDIEEELYRIHAELRQQKDASGESAMEVCPTSDPAPPRPPFVRVDKVDAGSPATDAGLEVGDELVEFGSVTANNFTSLQQIGEVVQHSIGQQIRKIAQHIVGRPLRVRVARNKQTVTLSLTPGPWNGRGNLGCNIVAIKR